MSVTAKNQGVTQLIDGEEQQTLLNLAESYLRESVAPMASEIDTHPEALQEALQGLGDRFLLALRVPPDWGGGGVNEATYRRFQMLVPRYSGALAFLQAQHQTAAGFLANSNNEVLKAKFLPYMGKGHVLIGVGFSQLRRQGEPLVKALSVAGGYQIEGTVPWVTGFGFFQEFIVAATLPDGRAVYGVVPFVATVQETGGTITFSEPMELGAISSTNTVTATLTHWFLPEESVVFIQPADAIHENDQKNVLHHSFFALGCAKAGLDLVEVAYQTKQLPFIQRAFEGLNNELTRCESAIMQALSPNSQTWEAQLQLRAWAINLAQRCASAAVTVSSGAANYRYHAAQRVYREALVFTVSGQTIAVMEATLRRLVHEGNR